MARGSKKATIALLWRSGLFLGVLGLVALTYFLTRNLVYRSLLLSTVQQLINQLATANVESVGSLTVDTDGNIVLGNVEVSATRNGVKRTFYRAKKAVLTFDGWPLRDRDLRLARVDLFDPEIFVRRDGDGTWNLTWILRKPPPPPEPAVPPPPLPAPPPPLVAAPPPTPAKDPFPFNGIHLHHGLIRIAIEGREGREFSWEIHNVEAQIDKDEKLHIGPVYGDFYGGRFRGNATVHSLKPFAISTQLTVTNADVAKIAEGRAFEKRPISGRLDATVGVSADTATSTRPTMAGQIEIVNGDLFDLPAFTGIIGLLALNPFSERKLDSAQILFTVEKDRVRIDRMNFLGSPISLFGEGEMTLTGEEMKVLLIPRLGRSWNDIISIIRVPIQLLTDIAMGSLVPVAISGPFWAPHVEVAPKEKVSEPVRKLIEDTPQPK